MLHDEVLYPHFGTGGRADEGVQHRVEILNAFTLLKQDGIALGAEVEEKAGFEYLLPPFQIPLEPVDLVAEGLCEASFDSTNQLALRRSLVDSADQLFCGVDAVLCDVEELLLRFVQRPAGMRCQRRPEIVSSSS